MAIAPQVDFVRRVWGVSQPMSIMSSILLDVFIIFVAAKAVGELFDRLGQPAVIGELLIGIVIGPSMLGLIGAPSSTLIEAFHGDKQTAKEALKLVYEVLAEIGVIFLLFFVGLETRLEDVIGVGARATVVAFAGVVLPFLFGWGIMAALGHTTIESIFVGTAMVATSVGITARVLADFGVLASREARIILGAAVIDDVIGMVALAIVAGMGSAGGVSWESVGLTILVAVLFVLLVTLVGARVMRRYSLHLDRLRIRNAAFVVAVAACLGLATLASVIGLAAIIGAFLTGMVFAEADEQHELETRSMPVYDLFVPFFFVVTGARVDPSTFFAASGIGLVAAVTALAVIGKVVGCGAAAWGNGWRSAAIIGVGMAPRGEVGLIVATFGQRAGVLSPDVYTVIVAMSVLTTLIVPPFLKLLYAGYAPVDLSVARGAQADPAKRDWVLPDM